MAYNGGSRSSASGNNSSLILGILIGMVLGLVIAGGVAWYISKRPSTFLTKEQREAMTADSEAPAAATQKPVVPATQPAVVAPTASSAGNDKPRFEFYKILTDKDSASPKTSAPKTTKETAKPATQSSSYFLQAGSFSNAGEADKLKARLALIGMEASVNTADVPGKGIYYRVRLGPFHNSDELNRANTALKQNGINDAAQVHAQ